MNALKTRLYQYWFVDGIYEIGFGFGLILFGCIHYGVSLLPSEGLRNILMGIGYPVMVLVVMWGVGKAVQWMKQHITYPRSGYIRYRKNPWQKKLKQRVVRMLIVLVLIAGANSLAALYAEQWGTQVTNLVTWVVFGSVFAGASFWLGIRFDLKRYYALAVFHILTGAATALWFQETHQMLAFMSISGIGWMISGTLTLMIYLRDSRKSKGEDDAETDIVTEI